MPEHKNNNTSEDSNNILILTNKHSSSATLVEVVGTLSENNYIIMTTAIGLKAKAAAIVLAKPRTN